MSKTKSCYLGPFHWACADCGRIHFMEVQADACCTYPYIKWQPLDEEG